MFCKDFTFLKRRKKNAKKELKRSTGEVWPSLYPHCLIKRMGNQRESIILKRVSFQPIQRNVSLASFDYFGSFFRNSLELFSFKVFLLNTYFFLKLDQIFNLEKKNNNFVIL